MSLVDYLELIPVQGRFDSLSHLLKIAGLRAVSTRKADLISALDHYLSDERNIVKIWNGLKPAEKELLEEYVRCRGSIDYDDIRAILVKYNLPLRKYYGFTDFFEQNSSARLFFIGQGMPKPIYDVLVKLIRPLELKYTILSESALNKNKKLQKIAVGKSFEKDCINYIKLVNNTKLRTAKSSGLPTKAAMIKINEVLVNKESLIDAFSLEDYRVIEQTLRIYGLSQLLLHACILEDADGVLTIGWQANDFLRLNHAGKCRMLLHDYLEADGIFELDRIRAIKVRTDFQPKLTQARKVVLKYLGACPVNSWIALSELLRFIRKNDRKFLTGLVGEIETYNDYERYYSSGNHSWNEVEGSFVQVVLLEYLSIIGIVDLMVREDSDDYGEKVYYSVNYLRLTPLGAYVLGVFDHYEEPEKEMEFSGILIQPNYEVVVAAGGMQEVHTLFLDRFAEKVSEGVVNVYKLSFKAVAIALDQGIPVQELIDYFLEFSVNPLPENVLLTLQEWERDSKKIRIRTVTILEMEDQYLLEELKSYKTIRNHIRNDLSYVLEIDEKSAKKLKREIEKKNRFCLMEPTGK